MELELEEECKIFEEKLQQDLVSESAIVDFDYITYREIKWRKEWINNEFRK